MLIFFKWAIPDLFFFIFVPSKAVKYQTRFGFDFDDVWDSNRRPLMLEADALLSPYLATTTALDA